MSCAVWTVKVVEGPDRGQSWRVEDAGVRRVLIGKGPACDLRLTDADAGRRHAALEQDESGLRILDLGSKGGLAVGRTRIRDAYLSTGDVIELGATKLSFDATDASADAQSRATSRRPTASEATSFGGVLGVSPQMRALFPVLARLAKTELPVLIEGETGTGKELVAESLHRASSRKNGPFATFDCRGAAVERDFVEEANQGTLFLDEIGDLNIALQVKLLRILEGSGGPRIIAATRLDLDREVEAGRFRDDLLHRLTVTRVELPPLRRRKGDIEFLARRFFETPDLTLPSDVVARWEAYDWPGNIRELKSALPAVAAPSAPASNPASSSGPVSGAVDFLRHVVTSGMTYPLARDKVVEEFTRRYVEYMLQQHGGNVTRAAAASGIGRRYFQMVRGKTA